jgi:hypothetical protein
MLPNNKPIILGNPTTTKCGCPPIIVPRPVKLFPDEVPAKPFKPILTSDSVIFNKCNRSPYAIGLTNISRGATSIANFVLFGYNKYSKVANYGSDVNVVYSMTNSSYPEMLATSTFNPFIIKQFRIFSSNQSNLNQILSINYENANGIANSEDLALSTYISTYQVLQQTRVVDIKYKADGTFFILGTLQPNSSMLFVILPDVAVNISNLMDEGDIYEYFLEGRKPSF